MQVEKIEINKVHKTDVLEIYTDGAARNNPGKGSCAYVFVLNNEIILEEVFFLGTITNNQAEYQGLIRALDKAIEYTRWNVKVFSDSELVINQMTGNWRVKDQDIKRLYREAAEMERGIQNIEYFHVPRENEYIKKVDKLCNKCVDEKIGKKLCQEI
jgi:ribonuclease HI